MNSKNRILDEDIFKTLKQAGFPEDQAKEFLKSIREGQEKKVIQEFQGALSYWAEFLNDTKQKLIVTLDGRDTAGKGSNIKRITEQLDTRRYTVKAFPGIPKAEEKFEDAWFQRYEAFFPQEGSVRFFDRSWYNRASVEAAMGFCTQSEYEWFMEHVNDFEKDRIIEAGYDFIKVHLSIDKKTQKERLKKREEPRKRWKSSPVDAEAQEKWQYYTLAKQRTLELTDSPHAPWLIIDSNEKFESTIEIIKAMIRTRDEIRRIIEKDLSIDLSLNPAITRTAQQELVRMQELGMIPVEKEFKFRKDT